MSETIRTVDIAAAIGTAITAQVGTLSTVPRVRWEPDRNRTPTTDDDLQRPVVGIRVHEVCNNQGAQNTRLRDVNVTIQAQTDYPEDPGQLVLSEIAQAVGEWILSPPTLTLTSCDFRRLSLNGQPQRDETIDRVQVVTWECIVGIMYPTA